MSKKLIKAPLQILVLLIFFLSQITVFTQVPGDVVFNPTVGEEKVLFIRINYPDDPNVTLTDDRAQAHADSVEAIIAANSYGELTFDIDITPVLTMPQPKSFYTLDDRLWIVRLRADALKIVDDAGFSINEYDREAIYSVDVWPQPLFGIGGFNNRTIITEWDNAAHTCHEFGHTFDWRHANLWRVDSSTYPLDTLGNIVSYGDRFDIMGDYSKPHHFNPWFKWRVGWLPEESILTVTESGNYIVQGVNLAPMTGSVNSYSALRIRRTPEMEFYVYFRSLEPFAKEGALISIASPSNASQILLLDMMPQSQGQEFNDAPLLVGETLIDSLTGIEITLIQKNNDSLYIGVDIPPATIDVVPRINFVNPENGNPLQGDVTYEVTAYDPDIGDINGAGIDSVKFSLGYIEGNNPYVPGGTEFIEVATGFLTSPPYLFQLETNTLPDECYRLDVTAISQNGRKNKAIFNHIIDNTGPSNVTSIIESEPFNTPLISIQSKPNPFSNTTEIFFQLQTPSEISLKIVDSFGNNVKTLVKGDYAQGPHSIEWHGDNHNEVPVKNGVYICQLQSGDFVKTSKILLIR